MYQSSTSGELGGGEDGEEAEEKRAIALSGLVGIINKHRALELKRATAPTRSVSIRAICLIEFPPASSCFRVPRSYEYFASASNALSSIAGRVMMM